MSEAAVEELSVLSSIYCAEGQFQLLQQSAQDGLVVQINSAVGGGRGPDVSVLFHLHPGYPSCPPDISVSSAGLSRTRCHDVRQKLLDRAAALPPEPMVHRLVECLQQVTEDCRGGEEVKEREEEEEWTAVLLLDHIRSRNRYVALLERWTQQLQLTVRLLLGRSILVILQGARPNIKEFCCLLRTVKVDVDSSGKKCKERMMKVLIETLSSSSHGHGFASQTHESDVVENKGRTSSGFVVKNYQSLAELAAAFQEINMTELYQQILPSLSG